MGAAAGNTVGGIFRGADAYYGDVLVKGQSFPEGHIRYLFPGFKSHNRNRSVLPDNSVGQKLAACSQSVVNLRRTAHFRICGFILQTDIYCHVILSHMEAPVHTAALLIEYSGENVLAAVALHVVKTPVPVKTAVD